MYYFPVSKFPLKDWSLRKQLILFAKNLNQAEAKGKKAKGNKLNCFLREQSLSVYFIPSLQARKQSVSQSINQAVNQFVHL